MVSRETWVSMAVCTLGIVLLASCDTVEVSRLPNPGRGPGIGHGPPAHAKAHGYRRKQVCGYDLIYDADRGIYVVVGLADCYYHDGHFFRLCNDGWQISLRADSGWGPMSNVSLPPGLRKKAQAQGHVKGQASTAPTAHVKISAQSSGKGKGYAKGKR